MSERACRLPSEKSEAEAAIIKRLIAGRRIAIVGLSDDPDRTSHRVAAYLQSVGKIIIPVNPNVREVLGVPAVSTLEEIGESVDLVNVFRRAKYCPAIARSAVAIRAGGLWLQSGIASPEARQIATVGELGYVEARCLMVEHRVCSR